MRIIFILHSLGQFCYQIVVGRGEEEGLEIDYLLGVRRKQNHNRLIYLYPLKFETKSN